MATAGSPSLAPSSSAAQSAVPLAPLGASGAAASGGATQPPKKPTGPVLGDQFPSSHGHGGDKMKPLFQDPVLNEKDSAASKLMKNLLFAPTHRSYEKTPATAGHKLGSFMHEDTGDWYVLPFVLRDGTKFGRPVVPLFRRDDKHHNARLIYAVYGNDASAQKGATIMYNVDEQHGRAIGSHMKHHPVTSGSTFMLNKMDFQVRYIMYRLTEMHGKALKIVKPNEVEELLSTPFEYPAYKSGISLLVLDGINDEICQKLKTQSTAPLDDDAPDSTDAFTVMCTKLSDYTCASNDLYVTGDKPLQTLRCVATLKWAKISGTPPAPGDPASPPPRAPRPGNNSSLDDMMLKRPPAAGAARHQPQAKPAEKKKRESSDSDDSDGSLAPPAKTQKKVPEKAEKVEKAEKKKKKRGSDDESSEDEAESSGEEEEDEDEMSGSGSDAGSDDSDDDEEDEEEGEEDDSEASDDDSDDDAPGKKIGKTASAGDEMDLDEERLQPQIKQNGGGPRKEGKGDKADKDDKGKRKPAKNRREGIARHIGGVMDHLKALDDAVPTLHKDRLDTKITKVEEVLVNYVDGGRVEDGYAIVNAQTMLINELGMLVAKIGAADGPRGPDSAASRKLALTMGRLCEKEQPELKELNSMLNTWAGKMADMMSRRAQAQLELNQAAAGLVAPPAASSSYRDSSALNTAAPN